MNSAFKPGLATIHYDYSGIQISKLRRFQGERFVFRIFDGDSYYKIFHIVFQSGDGSFFVDFPYFAASEGIVAHVPLDAEPRATNVALPMFGKITSHLVKFSYHPDGETHFSQDGKVLTQIRKKTLPLTDVRGHVFTVLTQGIGAYEKDTRGEQPLPTRRRTTLTYRFEEVPQAVKFVGRWFKSDTLLTRSGVLGPRVLLGQLDTPASAFFIGPLETSPMKDYCLLVSCEPIQPLDKDRLSLLTFIGGFDQHAADENKATSILALQYPVSNYDELVKGIGSIDYQDNSIPSIEPEP